MIQNPSQYQLNIFDSLLNTTKNLVVQAVPGSGKTTTIITASKLLPPSLSSAFVAFNKSIVEELKNKLTSNVVCKTAHSFGMTALIDYYRINFKVNPYKNLRFIEERLKLKKELSVKEKISLQFILLEVIDLVRMNMLNYEVDAIEQLCDHHDIILENPEILDCIEILQTIDFYNKSFSKTHNVIDFTDMIYLSVGNPKIKLPMFDCVFIDEVQDLNKAQQLLVEKLIKPKGRLISVGDRNQSIYGFAGADGNSFEYFEGRTNTITLPLSISYRCSKSIVENAKKVYPDIECFENNQEGEVRYGSIGEIEKDDMVICRNTRPLIDLYFKLLERGQSATIVGRDIEVGLNKILAKVINCDIEVGLEKLAELKLKLKEELKAKGIRNVNTNKKYINLHEQIQVIKILCQGCEHMSQVESKIIEMFKEDKKDAVKLRSIHRAKGLEADRVFLIERFEGKRLIPSTYAVRPWELVQENNILFVALTRAKKSLILINL